MSAYKKSAEMRNNIMEAMKSLVLQNGYGKTAVKDIADYLGVPRSLIYYYFKNKEDIMIALYREWFSKVDSIASNVLPQDTDPLIRMMTKLLVFRREVLVNPLFTEFIVSFPEYAAQGRDGTDVQLMEYYSDSRYAFEHYGKPTDGKEFRIHALMLESVERGLIVGAYYKTVEFTEREYMEYLGERTILPSFDLTRDQLIQILDQAFVLADQAAKPGNDMS